MIPLPKPVRTFALARGADTRRIVGYGLVLPDGSAVSVSWPPDKGFSFFTAGSAQENAELRGADLMWMGDQP